MLKKTFVAMFTLTVMLAQLHAEPASPQVVAQARVGLDRAATYYRSLAVHGGYVFWYSLDGTQRWGDQQAQPNEIWVRPPGTTLVGQTMLDAYLVSGDTSYWTAAQEIADALAWGQLASGGWDVSIDFGTRSSLWYRRADIGLLTDQQIAARKNSTHFDDNVTQSALTFLINIVATAGPEQSPLLTRVRAALDYGLQALLNAQYPNGAWIHIYNAAPRNDADFPVIAASLTPDWPRTYTSGQPYHSYYTINDDTTGQCMRVALLAHQRLGRSDCLSAARRAGDFFRLAQLPEPQPGWAQQYNFQMQPAWARRFEPPAVSSRETCQAVNALLDLYVATGDQTYLAPVSSALAWLRRSQITPNNWARFYELGTNRPIYMTPEDQISYSDERLHAGYSFRGDFATSTIAHAERVLRGGAAAVATRSPNPAALEEGVSGVLALLDAQGRWISNGRIESSTFATNVGVLTRYLQSANPPTSAPVRGRAQVSPPK